MNRILFSLLLLAGAAVAQPRQGESDEAFEIRLRATYSAPCNEAGYKPFTEPHDKCIIVLYRKDQDEWRRRQGMAQAESWREYGEAQRKNSQQFLNSIQPKPTVTCVRTPLGIQCQ